MTDRKPVTLDDLDREELLQLARDTLFVREMDLIWAQWQVLVRRRRQVGQQAIALYTPIADAIAARGAASDAYGASLRAYKSPTIIARANKALREAELALDALEVKQKRLFDRERSMDRRADQLLALHKEMRG